MVTVSSALWQAGTTPLGHRARLSSQLNPGVHTETNTDHVCGNFQVSHHLLVMANEAFVKNHSNQLLQKWVDYSKLQ